MISMKILLSLSDIFWTSIRYLHTHPFLLGLGLVLGFHKSFHIITEMGTYSESSGGQTAAEQAFVSYVEHHWEWIFLAGILLILLSIALWIVRAWVFSTIVYTAYAITKKRKSNLSAGLRHTWRSVWKVLFLELFLAALLGILSVILGLPTLLFWGIKADVTAIALGTLAAILFVSIGAILVISFRFGMIYAILEPLKPRSALDAGYRLFTKKVTESVSFFAAIVSLEIVVMLLLWLFPILILQNDFTLSIKPVMPTWMFGLYTLLAAAVLSIFLSFKNTAWTVFFIRIAKQEKNDAVKEMVEKKIMKMEEKIEPVKNVE